MRTLQLITAITILSLTSTLMAADTVPLHARAVAPWDPVGYLADLDGYLDQVVPTRAFQTAPDGTAPPLEVIGSRGHTVATGQAVWLKVRTEPGFPATFSSLHMGGFERNGQASISVKADDEGVAKAQFVATPGTSGFVEVIAASPVRTGQIGFVIQIE